MSKITTSHKCIRLLKKHAPCTQELSKIENFARYVLVDLNNPQIWVYKKSNDWQAEKFTLEQSFYLDGTGYQFNVADVYDRFKFD